MIALDFQQREFSNRDLPTGERGFGERERESERERERERERESERDRESENQFNSVI